MGTEVQPRPKVSRRTVATAVGASLLLVLLIMGLAFANSVGAARVAENAATLHWANATAGTSALTRAALVQAITFAEIYESTTLFDAGDVDPTASEEVDFAMGQLDAAYDELNHLLELGEDPEALSNLARFVARVGDAKQQLEVGSAERAADIAATTVEAAYMELSESLTALQATVQTQIEDNTRAAGRLSAFAMFFVTLAIPAAAVIVYWLIARRQVRELRIRSESELEAERAISRAKDSFVAGLSHELRTPLTSIYGFAEVLTDGRLDDEAQAGEVAQIIANEAAEMTRMVDDLLAASRLESTGIEIDPAPTNLDDIIESAITPFERAGMTVKRQPSGVSAVTDGARLRHVLVNLVSNAARHGGENIGVEVSPGEDSVDIEVWDDGKGVSEDRLETLFERFIHNGAEPLLTGSIGLGLAVASRITSLLGGRLAYQRFGGKTYFIVSVPVGDVSIDLEKESLSVADMIKALSS